MAPRARRFRIQCALIAGCLCAFALTDDYYWGRMGTLADKEGLRRDGAAMARVHVLRAGLQMLSDHPTGVGLGNFSRTVGRYDRALRYRSSHNTVIMAFCELGILGGIIFLLICAESIRLLIRCSRMAHLTDDPLETKLIVYGLLVALISYFVAGLGTERFSCESFWWTLALPVCLSRLVEREVAARAAATKEESDPETVADLPQFGGLCHEI